MIVVITVSKTFFPQHPKAGKHTYFSEKIDNNFRSLPIVIRGEATSNKIHTCRSNYEYWAKKISRLKEAGGVLSVRKWIDKPYKKPGQKTIINIPAEQIGVQKLTFERNTKYPTVIDAFVDGKYVNYLQLANNDGLSTEDFEAWFKDYNISEPMAIIHFTEFRY